MIWEQGSIVIVNLTRLCENGVSVCHRYWPEEGSDLYHIYEVRTTIRQSTLFDEVHSPHRHNTSTEHNITLRLLTNRQTE